MLQDSSVIIKLIVSILLFPTFFQEQLVEFVWAGSDPFWIMFAKRILLLLPALAVIAACWLSVASMVTVVVRQNRKEFVSSLLVTWWDLGKAIASFWGGFFTFLFVLLSALLGAAKVLLMGLWTLIQDIIIFPLRAMHWAGARITHGSIPWIAVLLTLIWSLVETTIFTYVTTPLVIDTFSNITGEQFSETMIRIPLFLFLFFIVLGSYAVLSTFVDVAKSRQIGAIIGIGLIEIIVLMVEVVFLYREFVDSLVPWLAQYAPDFELGIFWTLTISGLVWIGVRSLSWFLFAAHGTPVILSIIQGKGLGAADQEPASIDRGAFHSATATFFDHLRGEVDWLQDKSDRILGAFILPPLQIVAGVINFCTLLISSDHLFKLPFTSIREITSSKELLKPFGNRHPVIEHEKSVQDAG